MKIAGRRDYSVSIESVAMTDIVLNMFIFFFISFSLLYTFSPERHKKLDIKLPEASQAAPLRAKEFVTVSVTSEGMTYLDGELLTATELKAQLQAQAGQNPDIAVVLTVDKAAQFKGVVAILDMLTELGIKNLNVSAQTPR
jgi:biopolymer transport protein ExbD